MKENQFVKVAQVGTYIGPSVWVMGNAKCLPS